MRLVSKFLKHVVPGVIKPLMVLWNEVIGFIFLVLAVFVAFSTYRRAQRFTGDTGGLMILVASFTFALLLAVYGVSSFRKARKISRS
jgi:hypothetical protein